MVRLWVQERLNRLRLFILKRSCRSSPVPLGWPWRRKAPFDDDGGRPSTGDGRRCRFATNAAEGSTLDAHGCTADDHTGTPQGKHQHRQGGHGPGDCDEAAGERYGPGDAKTRLVTGLLHGYAPEFKWSLHASACVVFK